MVLALKMEDRNIQNLNKRNSNLHHRAEIWSSSLDEVIGSSRLSPTRTTRTNRRKLDRSSNNSIGIDSRGSAAASRRSDATASTRSIGSTSTGSIATRKSIASKDQPSREESLLLLQTLMKSSARSICSNSSTSTAETTQSVRKQQLLLRGMQLLNSMNVPPVVEETSLEKEAPEAHSDKKGDWNDPSYNIKCQDEEYDVSNLVASQRAIADPSESDEATTVVKSSESSANAPSPLKSDSDPPSCDLPTSDDTEPVKRQPSFTPYSNMEIPSVEAIDLDEIFRSSRLMIEMGSRRRLSMDSMVEMESRRGLSVDSLADTESRRRLSMDSVTAFEPASSGPTKLRRKVSARPRRRMSMESLASFDADNTPDPTTTTPHNFDRSHRGSIVSHNSKFDGLNKFRNSLNSLGETIDDADSMLDLFVDRNDQDFLTRQQKGALEALLEQEVGNLRTLDDDEKSHDSKTSTIYEPSVHDTAVQPLLTTPSAPSIKTTNRQPVRSKNVSAVDDPNAWDISLFALTKQDHAPSRPELRRDSLNMRDVFGNGFAGNRSRTNRGNHHSEGSVDPFAVSKTDLADAFGGDFCDNFSHAFEAFGTDDVKSDSLPNLGVTVTGKFREDTSTRRLSCSGDFPSSHVASGEVNFDN